ncbi:MAG: PfkB family carbohydrate kinase [Actinomycetaceae bacterium]|nr:PfkB family carbohydrate kinase [Actinomycetaceae bacterium]
MYGLFSGLTTLDVAQLTAETVAENTKVTSLDQVIAAGGPATNAAVTFSALTHAQARLIARKQLATEVAVAGPGNPMATVLMTAVGDGLAAHLIADDIESHDIALIDCTDYTCESSPHNGDYSPAVSAIFVNSHTGARTLASTNARLPIQADIATASLATMGKPQVVLIDGHNPQLGMEAVTLGTDTTDTDPFAAVENKPPYLRILDGGSWKPWLTPMLGFVDIAVLSADFVAPGATTVAETVDFLRGFGITRIIQTNGEKPTRWWWDDAAGSVTPPTVNAVCTLAAGDVFHGAFAWACANDLLDRDSSDPVSVIDFANRVAALSTTRFGTRTWLNDEDALDDILRHLYS